MEETRRRKLRSGILLSLLMLMAVLHALWYGATHNVYADSLRRHSHWWAYKRP